jgi:hypothetical protein
MTALAGLGSASSKWASITYAKNVGRLFASPASRLSTNPAAVLIIDPVANTTSIASLSTDIGSTWRGFTFEASVGRLFAAPFSADAVLIVGFAFDASALLPFRLVSELNNTVISTQAVMYSMQVAQSSTEEVLVLAQSSTQAAMSSAEATLVSAQTAMSSMQDALLSSHVSQSATEAALASTLASLASTQAVLSSMQADLESMQAELNTVDETVCNQPACAAGTHAINGACVPDCTNLRRRDTVRLTNDNGNEGSDGPDGSSTSSILTWHVAAVFIGGALAIALVGRFRYHETHEAPQQAQ